MDDRTFFLSTPTSDVRSPRTYHKTAYSVLRTRQGPLSRPSTHVEDPERGIHNHTSPARTAAWKGGVIRQSFGIEMSGSRLDEEFLRRAQSL